MTKKYYCDRCEKEIDSPEGNEFNDFFKDVEGRLSLDKEIIEEPELCGKCQKGYNKIVKETNKQIDRYLKEK